MVVRSTGDIGEYRNTSFSATLYYLANGIFVERTKKEVALYERVVT